MEKQDLDNLQQTTKNYSDSATWVSSIMLGAILTIHGIMMYFKIDNSVIFLLFFVLMVSYFPVSKRLKRTIMNKGLGYVGQKEGFTSLKQELSHKQILFLILFCIVIALSVVIKDWKNWDDRTFYTGMFLFFGLIGTIIGLMNRKKIVSLYAGIYCIACGLILYIFYAHKMIPEGITDIFLGFGFIVLGVVYYFQYKKIVREVKNKTQTNG
ncbi:MAG: hypothetical protein WC614_09175 [bacterium]